jgi:alpha-beta hydrolase superfamily lysophospholipase
MTHGAAGGDWAYSLAPSVFALRANPRPPLRRGSAAKAGCGRPVTALLLLLVALLAACAPMKQGALAPADPVQPGFTESWFESFDGARLGLNVWRPAQPALDQQETVIIAVHGMNDYAGAFNGAGAWWSGHGATVYAYDQRGFGRSPQLGVWADPDLFRKDLKAAVDVARRLHPNARIAVVGESMGAAVALTAFASSDPPKADALILSGPGLRGWGALPMLYRVSLWASAHVRPGWIVVPPRGISITPTDNRDKLIEMWNDPHVLKTTRIDAVYGVVSIMEEADRDIADLPEDVPALMLYGARDEVIPEVGVKRAVKRLPAHVRTAYYKDGYHMLMNDLQAESVWADVLAFARSPIGPLPSKSPPIPWVRDRRSASR